MIYNHIAFVGKMCTGKTSLTNYMVREGGYKHLSFARKVKQIATDLFFMDPGQKDRELLQQIGTKMREVRTSVWLDYLRQEILNLDPLIPIVIDDCRFLNEAQMLDQEFSMVLIGLERNDEDRLKSIRELYPGTTEEQLFHCSEIEVPSIIMEKCSIVFRDEPLQSVEKTLHSLFLERR